MTKRFKLYDEETLDTHIEDNEDCYSDGTPKSYWFGENEDFCNLFYKLNELSDENLQLKQQLRNSVELFRKDSVTLFELKEENKELKVNYKELRYANNIYCNKIDSLKKENEQLKQQLSDINGQLVMLDNCDNWDYDRMKHTVREIAEIIGYNGTINPKR